MNFLKRRWLNWQLRRAKNGDARAISRLYWLRDPWGLCGPTEQFRFEETTRFIRERIGTRFESVLEVGCGEGLQTKYLAPLADKIVGIDLGPQAIERARAKRIKNAMFKVGDLTGYQKQGGETFGLVTACEVFYYFKDLEHTYSCLNQLGQCCVATYYQGEYPRMDAFFRSKAVNFDTIRGPVGEWRIVWWKNTSDPTCGVRV
jgi:2-polyprenyl-3-methyl-5-hydroxy-6-metoxy-1,4-benzoquinol methylase